MALALVPKEANDISLSQGLSVRFPCCLGQAPCHLLKLLITKRKFVCSATMLCHVQHLEERGHIRSTTVHQAIIRHSQATLARIDYSNLVLEGFCMSRDVSLLDSIRSAYANSELPHRGLHAGS